MHCNSVSDTTYILRITCWITEITNCVWRRKVDISSTSRDVVPFRRKQRKSMKNVAKEISLSLKLWTKIRVSLGMRHCCIFDWKSRFQIGTIDSYTKIVRLDGYCHSSYFVKIVYEHPVLSVIKSGKGRCGIFFFFSGKAERDGLIQEYGNGNNLPMDTFYIIMRN